MHWTSDRTGRFPARPYYHPDELESKCESLITAFLRSRYGRVAFPVATDDLTVLVERLGGALDLYADLSSGERGVQGFTEFVPGRRPLVRISRRLSEDSRYENRLRTTLTHEGGHLWLHRPLWERRWRLGRLVGGHDRMAYVCQQPMTAGTPRSDWAEWQAGYVSGALLMPASPLRAVIRGFAAGEELFWYQVPLPLSSRTGYALVRAVMTAFAVSEEAAQVRLVRQGVLTDEVQGRLFA